MCAVLSPGTTGPWPLDPVPTTALAALHDNPLHSLAPLLSLVPAYRREMGRSQGCGCLGGGVSELPAQALLGPSGLRPTCVIIVHLPIDLRCPDEAGLHHLHLHHLHLLLQRIVLGLQREACEAAIPVPHSGPATALSHADHGHVLTLGGQGCRASCPCGSRRTPERGGH